MTELAAQLKQASRRRAPHLIATDGVFSMDGVIANLKGFAIWRTSIRRW